MSTFLECFGDVMVEDRAHKRCPDCHEISQAQYIDTVMRKAERDIEEILTSLRKALTLAERSDLDTAKGSV